MFIKKIRINNYRSFDDFYMEFKEGLNVIIGSNNSGKTNLLKAICLLNEPNSVTVDDFNKNNITKYFSTDYKDQSPEIVLEYEVHHLIDENNADDESIIKLISFMGIDKIEEQKNTEEEVTKYNIVANVKMRYYLDSKYIETYKKAVANADTFKKYIAGLKILSKHYKWIFTNGITSLEVEKKDVTNIFEVDFIEAERTSDAIYRKIKKEISSFITDEQNVELLQKMQDDIADIVKTQVYPVLEKISTVVEDEKNEIGLAKGNVAISQDIRPSTSIPECYIIDIKDTQQGYIVPMSYNGVGYNNLVNIYMLIKLADLRKNNDSRILCLEEPEAHLHPAMQYKLISYLKTTDEEDNLKQQIFVTTHSSNIAAIAGIDNMYMLEHKRDTNSCDCVQQRLKNQFLTNLNYSECSEDKEDKLKKQSKKYYTAKKHLMKFLDVTRSDMLFASRIILVEGIAEKLLMPKLMEKIGYRYEDEHISIVEIGGKHFEYFLEIYAKNPIDKKVLCITDKDYHLLDESDKLKPIIEYSSHVPTHVKNIKDTYKECDNIEIYYQTGNGRTFEDELFLSNTEKESIAKSILKIALSNSFNSFIDDYGLNFDNWDGNIDELDGRNKKKIKEFIELFSKAIQEYPGNKSDYEKLFFANIFFHYAKSHKGDVALQILSDDTIMEDMVVPKYIEEGLKWLLK